MKPKKKRGKIDDGTTFFFLEWGFWELSRANQVYQMCLFWCHVFGVGECGNVWEVELRRERGRESVWVRGEEKN